MLTLLLVSEHLWVRARCSARASVAQPLRRRGRRATAPAALCNRSGTGCCATQVLRQREVTRVAVPSRADCDTPGSEGQGVREPVRRVPVRRRELSAKAQGRWRSLDRSAKRHARCFVAMQMVNLGLAAWRAGLFTALGLGTLSGCGGSLEGGDATDGEMGRGEIGGAQGGVGGASHPSVGTACQPIARNSPGPGFTECEGGWLHRERVDTCPTSLSATATGVSKAGPCASDGDCTAEPYGYCGPSAPGSGWRSCVYGCVRDDECGAGRICVCGNPVGRCSAATCATDADCEKGFLCAGNETYNPCGLTEPYEFACQRPADACLSSASCDPRQSCRVGLEARACSADGVCGRPFLIEGQARLADLCFAPAGWVGRRAPGLDELDPRVREALAAHWARLGLMEHASVAAFARFALELLALGAPAQLLLETQQALGDEIQHALSCFGLASAYAGHELGPGALSCVGALDARSPEEIVHTAILEACIGETMAAVEAKAALGFASDPEVRAVLSRIAADEARHAELGWRFLAWTLSSAAGVNRDSILRTLFSCIDAARETSPSVEDEAAAAPDAALLAHGLLGVSAIATARRMALHEIVLPCARALRDQATRCGEVSASRAQP